MKELYRILQNNLIKNSQNNLITTNKAKEIIGEIFHIKSFGDKIGILKEMKKMNFIKFKNRDMIEVNNDPDFIQQLKLGKKCNDPFSANNNICKGCSYYNKCLTIELNK